MNHSLRERLQKLIAHLSSSPLEAFSKLDQMCFDFYALMSRDLLIGYFFTGRDLRAIAHRQARFLWQSAGMKLLIEHELEPRLRSPTQAHAELPPVYSGHFDRRILLLRQFLKKSTLPANLAESWIDFELAFRNQVVSEK